LKVQPKVSQKANPLDKTDKTVSDLRTEEAVGQLRQIGISI